MDFINQLIQVLKKELVQLRDSVQELKEVGKLNLVKPQDEGQLSYVIKLKIQEYMNKRI